ncbi:DUF1648 domain-containing protein [Aquimarina litoralis]|uniref:DUF1648 domain-containing protein n=1 Tax=Aquimarina litoralis TaxID=584605 RepID=UPI001C594C8E|nr:DUF1648 domain-containing protein [Aquimarina litoralis]MBW1298626.1 DUF1648 domain-containing protein [Aquimarina litoralis]
MRNPIIIIKKDTIDIIIEVCTFIGLGLLIVLPFLYYSDLPDNIPTHFNAKGNPDNYSSKSMIWTLPVIGVIMISGLYILNRFPHVFNYPSKITKENALGYYKNSTKLVRALNLIIAWSFAYVLYGSIQVAIGNYHGIGNWFLPIFVGALFGIIIFFILKSRKLS